MTGDYLAPVSLTPLHACEAFECASEEQTRWLRDYALTAHQVGSTRVQVATEPNSLAVVAYYAWSISDLAVDDSPARLARGGGRYPQPMALLARLGVDSRDEGRGLGRELLRDVLLRTVAVADEIGCRGLMVHCENEAARSWYLRWVPAFDPSPTDPLHLALLVKDIRKSLGR